MSTLSGAWRAICRFMARMNAPVIIDQDMEAMRKDRRAERKALILLMRLLNPEQRQEFRESGHFHVTGGSSGDRYRIRVARIANVDVLRDNGTVKHRLCVHPSGGVPVYDVMAAQMLHLQEPVTEQRFLRQANIHPARPGDRGLSIFM
jgi:hypothetical protein